jgi:hypothetical protein
MPTDPRSKEDIERLAEHARLRLTGTSDPMVSFPAAEVFHGIADSRGLNGMVSSAVGRNCFLEYDVSDCLPGTLAVTYCEFAVGDEGPVSFCLAVTEETYVNLLGKQGRARFTLCHELGHLVMHSVLLLRQSKYLAAVAGLSRRTPMASHPHFRDTEWQADTFAAALLMPRAGVERLARERGSAGLEDVLVKQYDVSKQAAATRLKCLRLCD